MSLFCLPTLALRHLWPLIQALVLARLLSFFAPPFPRRTGSMPLYKFSRVRCLTFRTDGATRPFPRDGGAEELRGIKESFKGECEEQTGPCCVLVRHLIVGLYLLNGYKGSRWQFGSKTVLQGHLTPESWPR